MNKYEQSALAPEEKEAKQSFNRLFTQFKNIVLANKHYALGQAREIVESLPANLAKKLFERFNEEEGALPDELASEYIKLVYSPDEILEHMTGGEEFHEVLGIIGRELKQKRIELNPELVATELKASTKEIWRRTEAEKKEQAAEMKDGADDFSPLNGSAA